MQAVCSECDITLSLSFYERHMTCHGIQMVSCLHCPVTATSEAPMIGHMHLAHPGKMAFVFIRDEKSPIQYIGSKLKPDDFVLSNERNSDGALNSMSWQLGWQAKYVLITESDDQDIPCDLEEVQSLQSIAALGSVLSSVFRRNVLRVKEEPR